MIHTLFVYTLYSDRGDAFGKLFGTEVRHPLADSQSLCHSTAWKNVRRSSHSSLLDAFHLSNDCNQRQCQMEPLCTKIHGPKVRNTKKNSKNEGGDRWHDFPQVFSWFENRKNWKMQFLCWKVLCFHRERDGLSIFFSSLFAKDWWDGAARRRTEFSTGRFQWSSDLPVLSVLKLVSQRDVERCEWLNFGGWKRRRSILWHVGLREVHQQDWSRYRILETGGRVADHLWAVPWRLHRMLLCNDTRRFQKKLLFFFGFLNFLMVPHPKLLPSKHMDIRPKNIP